MPVFSRTIAPGLVRCGAQRRIGQHVISEIARVKLPAGLQLLQIADALDGLRLPLRSLQSREQHARQDSDDGDDYQQLDQRKATISAPAGFAVADGGFTQKDHAFTWRVLDQNTTEAAEGQTE